MNSVIGSILMVEDDSDFAESAIRVLRSFGYDVDYAERIADGVQMLRERPYDLLISDIHLPDGNGVELLKLSREIDPLLPVILATASGSTDLAVEATLNGAFDYLLKPLNRLQLQEITEKAFSCRQMSKEKISLPTQATTGDRQIIGRSPAMIGLFKEIGRVARQPVPVLLLGETGTGKEIIAKALYHYSGLTNKPFVPINCAAIPENLLESELFGHEKGAFTGATNRRIGRFEQAHGGMIFLDEIGELPLSMQAKLLRVLQEKEIQPLGGTETRKIDVRVIAATHRNLEEEIKAKSFREDLYFRLNLATLRLPPLRERRDDIPELIHYFLELHSKEGKQKKPSIHEDAIAWLQEQLWPGNIRELENAVRRAMMMTANGVITSNHVKAATDRTLRPHQTNPETLEALIEQHLQDDPTNPHGLTLLARLERQAIQAVLKKVQGNKTHAGQILGINRKTLREKIALYNLSESPEN